MADLLQVLFDAFFESLPEFKPTEAEIRLALQELQAIIFLDDLRLPNDEILSLLNSAPRCAFVFSSVERKLWGEGQHIHLQGLPQKDALALLERELGRSISDEELTNAKKIVELLRGHPLRILQTSSLVREKSRAIREISQQQRSADLEAAILQDIVNATSEEQKRSLAILSAAGGNALSLEHLAAISHDPNAQKTIEGLISLGLVGTDGPRYKLTGNLASTLSTLWNLSDWEDALVRYFIRWLEKEAAPALVESSAEALIYSIRRAGERKRWREVVLLGRALERYFILWKRWQAWAELLELILKAAKVLVDRKTEAWALHQMGSRAMCLGDKELAHEFLSQALDIRKAIKDKAGAKVTQHNLNVLLRGSGTLNGRKPNVRRWYIGSFGVGIAVLLLAIITIGAQSLPWLIPTIVPLLQVATDTYTPTLTSTPTFTSTPSNTPTSTFTASSTSTPTSTFTPTWTPTFTATATDTPTATPNPPTLFSNVATFPNLFHRSICGNPTTTSIYLKATDPGGVTDVEIIFWLNKKNTFRTNIRNTSSLQMRYSSNTPFGSDMWQVQINSADVENLVSNPGEYGEYWVQFRFVATDSTGVRTDSQPYQDRITYSYCIPVS